MKARLESKKQFSNSNIIKIEGMKYLDEQITISMKKTMYEGNKMQTIDTSIYEVQQCKLRPRRGLVSLFIL